MGKIASSAIAEVLLVAIKVAATVSLRERTRATVGLKTATRQFQPIRMLAEQIVTSADLVTQEAILKVLLDSGFSGAILQAEEDTPSLHKFFPRHGSPVILIDPIDGTLAFSIVCAGWERTLLNAGYQRTLIDRVRQTWDSSLYGPILGAILPKSEDVLAACALPELHITYHLSNGRFFRNGNELHYSNKNRSISLTADPCLLERLECLPDPPLASDSFRPRVAESLPGVLWRILEGESTCYAGVLASFDSRITAYMARAAGLMVTDEFGQEFPSSWGASSASKNIIFTSTRDEIDRICAALQHYPLQLFE